MKITVKSYLNINKSSPTRGGLLIQFGTAINVDVESIECVIYCDSEDVDFAFYLNVDGENVEQRWYSKENHATFKLIFDRTKSHTVIFFVRDKMGDIHRKSSILNHSEIDFIPSFSIRKNKISCNIETSQNSSEFAFYLYLNDEKVRQKWYSEYYKVEYEIDETPIEKFEIIFFIKDSESNVVSRSIKYDIFEPEENTVRSKNQYNFFISSDKKTIYKSINSSSNAFSKLLEKPGKMERFSKILNGEQFSSQINNYIVKGFDMEPNGSYKSNYIEGYRLDLIIAVMEKYPSLNLPSKLELEKITRQCDLLLEALQDAESKGELCGDWALHNLIFSTNDDKIYNIDLEGFMTYDPLPEWANLTEINNWINTLIV